MIYVITPYEHTFKAWCSNHKHHCEISGEHYDSREIVKISKREDLLGRTIKESDDIEHVAVNGFTYTEYLAIYDEYALRLGNKKPS